MSKPMLASNADLEKLKFPLWAQPKIDGVRALNMVGRLTGRSLKPFANKFTTRMFGHSALIGLDGELAVEPATRLDLCRLTTGAVNTIKDEPFLRWHLFDYVTSTTRHLSYSERFEKLCYRLVELEYYFAPEVYSRLSIIRNYKIGNMEELLEVEKLLSDKGYEGVIIRDPNASHKAGRSTVTEGGLLRIKRFIDAEARVVGIVEGEHNANEATTNALGLTERSTHQANMLPNGMVGSIICVALAQVMVEDQILIHRGQTITVSAGRLTASERKEYFENQNKILGRIIKFQCFPKGQKDKPRFPTFQSFRESVDIS